MGAAQPPLPAPPAAAPLAPPSLGPALLALALLLLLILELALRAFPPAGASLGAHAPSDGLLVPNLVHFIELSPPGAPFAFLLTHYLSVLAARLRLAPQKISWHHRALPEGEWWDCAAPLLTPVRAADVTAVHGKPMALRVEHKSDVTRFAILARWGGVYLDFDVLPLRNFTPLRAHAFTMGAEMEATGREHEAPGRGAAAGLCNAVIVAAPNASFLARWWAGYATFDPAQWGEHSVRLPLRLAAEHPGEINVLPGDAFFYPMWSAPQLKRLYEADDGYDFKNNYAVHLWAAAAEAVPAFRDLLRSLTVRDVFTCGGSFCRVARQLLADAHAARALCPAAEAEVGAMMAPGSPARRDWRGGAL